MKQGYNQPETRRTPAHKRLALAVASSLALTGCATPPPPKSTAKAVWLTTQNRMQPLPYCLEEPLFVTEKAPVTTPPINVVIKPNGVVEDNPGPLNTADINAIWGTIVRIDTLSRNPGESGYMGSGVIVRTSPRESLIVTAAHVPGATPIKDIKVTDTIGKESEVIDGCTERATGEQGERFIDVAILRTRHLGHGSLHLATSPPPRGVRNITYASFVGARQADNPAIFGAIAAGPLSTYNDYYFNGVQSGRDCRPYAPNRNYPDSKTSDCSSMGGASGCAVLQTAGNGQPQVVGIHLTSERDYPTGYLENSSLAKYGISLNMPANSPNIYPVIGVTMNSLAIQEALAGYDQNHLRTQ